MKRRIFLIAVLFLCAFSNAQVPTAKPSGTPSTRAESADLKWEYVVVSFGKALFSDVGEGKQTGLSKTVIYSDAGLQLGQEALTLQAQMDTLGKFGWDLVSVVGSIGGDQQMLFKRQFDPSRSAREAKMIEEEAKALASKRKKDVNPSEVSLIDLDKLDQDKEDADIQKSIETKYTEYTNKAVESKGAKVKSVIVAYENFRYESNSSKSLKVAITIDGTAVLLKEGNKFRTSDAKFLLKMVKLDVASSAGLKSFGTDTIISFAITINLNGKDIPVAWDTHMANSFK